jgi:hypothetical protein
MLNQNPGHRMQRLSQDEFFDTWYDYRPGESAVWISPTGGGKSHMMYRAVETALQQNPHLSINSCMPKPADATTLEWASKLNLRLSDSYPFKKKLFQEAPRGHVLWPPHIRGDEDANEEHLREQFKRMLSDVYWKGDSITCVDDAYRVVCGLKLHKYTDKFLTEGRSNSAGLFGTLQQPRGTVTGGAVSSSWYNQPTHAFYGKDGNAANRERFAEIACGLDPRMISDVVTNLKTYRVKDSAVSEMLYLDRRGPYLAIVTPF